MGLIAVILLLVFVAGYATQRGSICAVAAVHEMLRKRRAGQSIAFLLCAATALAAMALLECAGVGLFARPMDFPPGFMTIAGGAIFALGAHINGRCAFGTVGALGSGDLAYTATIAGFLGGAAILLSSDAVHPATLQPYVASPLRLFNPPATAAFAFMLIAILAMILRRQGGWTATAGGWSPLRAMAVIGLANAALLALAQNWPYTRLLTDIAAMHGTMVPRRIAITLVFLIGAIGGALVAHRFHWRRGTPTRWLRTSLGGFIMGIGAVLIPGGNDMMLMVGLPLLLANLSIAYAVMIATLCVLEAFAARRSYPSAAS